MSPIRRPRNRQSLTPRRSCTVLPLLAKRLILSFFSQNRSLMEESRQEAVKVETQTAPDAEKGADADTRAGRARTAYATYFSVIYIAFCNLCQLLHLKMQKFVKYLCIIVFVYFHFTELLVVTTCNVCLSASL